MTSMIDAKRLYDEDVVAWSEQQAEALRAAARGGSNLQLDWENLAEEIEDLAKSYRLSLRSHTRRIVQHLFKLQHSPAIDPRNGWRRTVELARMEVSDLLDESPSLKRDIPAVVKKVVSSGIELAVRDLERHDEVSPTQTRILRRRSYTAEQIFGDWFPPEPPWEPRRR